MSLTRIRASAGAAVDLDIFSAIGSEYQGGISAQQVVDWLRALAPGTQTIRVHINSPGGCVWAALGIAQALREQRHTQGRTVEVIIEGLCASAATVISSAGNPIRMQPEALMFVHLPFAATVGTADEHRQTAKALDEVTQQIVAAYRWVSSWNSDALRGLMQAETWLSADEAIQVGLATEKGAGGTAAAAGDAAAFWPSALVDRLGQAPSQHRARFDRLVSRAVPTSNHGWVAAMRKSGQRFR